MTEYRIPVPARSGPAAGSGSLERWLFGLCASYERWPQREYTFRLPPTGLPLYLGHEEQRIEHVMPGRVGAARRFAEVGGLGLVCLIEVDHPLILWDVAAGRRTGLSIGAALDPPPDDGPTWIYVGEVSLTGSPADPRARVISAGELALRDWEVLTGETVPELATMRTLSADCPGEVR